MVGAVHRLHQLREAHLQRQGDHAGAWHHHLAHLGVAQGEEALKHVALVGHQADHAVGFDQGFQLTGRESGHQFIPVARQPEQAQQAIAQPLQQHQQGAEAAHHRFEYGCQSQGGSLRAMQHPGLGHQTTEQRGQHHQPKEQEPIQPGLAQPGTGRPRAPALRQAPACPAQSQQGQCHAQLSGDQGSPQAALQAGHSRGTPLTIRLKQLHPGGAQPDQREFRGSEEGQQEQQGRRCQESHRVQMRA